MIRHQRVVTIVHLAQVVAELALIQGEVLQQATLLVQVIVQHRQGVARRRISQRKYVKLPVVLSTLQSKASLVVSTEFSTKRTC